MVRLFPESQIPSMLGKMAEPPQPKPREIALSQSIDPEHMQPPQDVITVFRFVGRLSAAPPSAP